MAFSFIPHSEFLVQLSDSLEKASESDISRLTQDPDWTNALIKVVSLNLDQTAELLSTLYEPNARKSCFQLETFRSMVLMSHFKCTSYDKWAVKVRSDPLLATLCGFFTSWRPVTSTFYNLIHRITPDSRISVVQDKDYFKKMKKANLALDKPKKGEKLENVPDGKTARLAAAAINGELEEDPYMFLHTLLKKTVVDASIDKNLIDTDDLNINGDSSATHVHVDPKGHSIKGDEDHRRYSDPEASHGWDSDLGVYFFGYHMYCLVNHNQDLKIDLPMFINLVPARDHDSVTVIPCLDTFTKLYSDLHIKYLCLDSAHDNEATYVYSEHLGAVPYIDLNNRKKKSSDSSTEHYAEDGKTMLCKGNIPMHFEGYDKANHKIVWRCPMAYKKDGVTECPLGKRCSNAKHGRKLGIRVDSLREKYRPFHMLPIWKEVYNNRTSTERMNNRILNDYRMHWTKARRKRRLMFQSMMAGINVHLDAWIKIGNMEI